MEYPSVKRFKVKETSFSVKTRETQNCQNPNMTRYGQQAHCASNLQIEEVLQKTWMMQAPL
jgi:hypothetical protein